MDALPVPAKYVAAVRHKGTLLQDHNNFLYNKSRKAMNKSFWVCSKKTGNGCRATATVSIKSTEADENDDRNHDSDLMAEAAKPRMG